MALITDPRVEGTVRVRDGRRLSFAEWGAPEGRAVVWLHGTPGARRQVPETARVAALERGVRLVAVDRPGVGLSTPHLYDAIADFAPDLGIVCDQLGLGRLTFVALSGGGPYALAAAAAWPERVAAVGLLGSVAPAVGQDAVPGGLVALAVRFEPLLRAVRVPAALSLRLLVRLLAPLGSPALDLYARISPEGDRIILSRPEVKAMFLDDLVGNTRRGFSAPVHDAILFARPWGFALSEVRCPVIWWHGNADHMVPLDHARATVARLPHAELRVRKGESHLGGLGAAEEVLDSLLAAGAQAPAATPTTAAPARPRAEPKKGASPRA
jgi:pimeloyl-ACP methyl ester carboxylesterase